MKIGFAQLDTTVGDLKGNSERILRAYGRLVAAGADLVLTPELALTGYPPQDLVFKSRFVPETHEILEQLHARIGQAALLVGFVDRNRRRRPAFPVGPPPARTARRRRDRRPESTGPPDTCPTSAGAWSPSAGPLTGP